jgi:hypothetical protein
VSPGQRFRVCFLFLNKIILFVPGTYTVSTPQIRWRFSPRFRYRGLPCGHRVGEILPDFRLPQKEAYGAESFKPMYVRFDKWEVILRHDVRRGIILGQHFESGFRRRISKKKNHDCIGV